MTERSRKQRKPRPGAGAARHRGQKRAPAAGVEALPPGEARPATPRPLRPHLELLYEISKLLLRFEDVERIVSSILAIVMETLPLRSAILIVEVDGRPRTILWKAEDLDAEALAAARTHARVAYGYLTGADVAESLSMEAVEAETRSFLKLSRMKSAPPSEDHERFILLPLVLGQGPIFGALQLEAAAPLNEAHLMLVNAIVNQLAVALDRHHAWRNDVALRQQAESISRQIAESERRKDEFLAMMGHELRNPLAPISTALELLRLHGVKEGGQRTALEILERQLEHLTRLVDDLLDVSRITRGKIGLQKQVVDLATVVTQAVESSQSLIQSHRHQLTVELPSEPVQLEADPMRLVQVIGNLLNNAAKYTEPGGRIDLTAELADGEAVIRVRDTGIGIAPEMLDEVFGLFTQVAPMEARSGGGLGVGLALVRRLVEMHGGRVEARSEGPGRGSEFTVRLPALPGKPLSRQDER